MLYARCLLHTHLFLCGIGCRRSHDYMIACDAQELKAQLEQRNKVANSLAQAVKDGEVSNLAVPYV